jgi:hypothetical protein
MDDAEQVEHREPVAVASFQTEGEAEVVLAKLAAFGIEAVVDDHFEGGMLPTEGEPGVVVVVRAQDAEDARQVLAPTTDEDTALDGDAAS